MRFNPISPNSDPSQISHCNIKSLSVREVMRIENMITQVRNVWRQKRGICILIPKKVFNDMNVSKVVYLRFLMC